MLQPTVSAKAKFGLVIASALLALGLLSGVQAQETLTNFRATVINQTCISLAWDTTSSSPLWTVLLRNPAPDNTVIRNAVIVGNSYTWFDLAPNTAYNFVVTHESPVFLIQFVDVTTADSGLACTVERPRPRPSSSSGHKPPPRPTPKPTKTHGQNMDIASAELRELKEKHDIDVCHGGGLPINGRFMTQSDMHMIIDGALPWGSLGGVDLYSGNNNVISASNPVEICFPDPGYLVIFDARQSPRQLRPLDTYRVGDRSCATVTHAGTVGNVPETRSRGSEDWFLGLGGSISSRQRSGCDDAPVDAVTTAPEPEPVPVWVPVPVTQCGDATRSDGAVVHIVQQGHHCWAIAEACGIYMEDIQRLNPQFGDCRLLHPGDELVVIDAPSATDPVGLSVDQEPVEEQTFLQAIVESVNQQITDVEPLTETFPGSVDIDSENQTPAMPTHQSLWEIEDKERLAELEADLEWINDWSHLGHAVSALVYAKAAWISGGTLFAAGPFAKAVLDLVLVESIDFVVREITKDGTRLDQYAALETLLSGCILRISDQTIIRDQPDGSSFGIMNAGFLDTFAMSDDRRWAMVGVFDLELTEYKQAWIRVDVPGNSLMGTGCEFDVIEPQDAAAKLEEEFSQNILVREFTEGCPYLNEKAGAIIRTEPSESAPVNALISTQKWSTIGGMNDRVYPIAQIGDWVYVQVNKNYPNYSAAVTGYMHVDDIERAALIEPPGAAEVHYVDTLPWPCGTRYRFEDESFGR